MPAVEADDARIGRQQGAEIALGVVREHILAQGEVERRRLGKAGELLHVGFDADPLLLEALSKGEVHSLMVQQAHVIGYQAVQLAVQTVRTASMTRPVARLLQDVTEQSRATENLRFMALNDPLTAKG